jgi:hypothetical protein
MKTKTITTRVPEDLFREIKEIGEMETVIESAKGDYIHL